MNTVVISMYSKNEESSITNETIEPKSQIYSKYYYLLRIMFLYEVVLFYMIYFLKIDQVEINFFLFFLIILLFIWLVYHTILYIKFGIGNYKIE